MKPNRYFLQASVFFLVAAGPIAFSKKNRQDDNHIVSYIADPRKQNLKFYWKDDQNKPFKSIQALKTWLHAHNKRLVFAMNGGMYKTDNSPLGLFIDNQITLSRINKSNGSGNFYLKPNGVLYRTTGGIPVICNTDDFRNNGKVKYATQSGPMLVIDGKIHPDFKKGSANLNIRNGAGILPDNRVVFAMSKNGINLYDIADYFKSMGCKNALYLDGFVSRMYLPEKQWIQTDGNFGVILGVSLQAE